MMFIYIYLYFHLFITKVKIVFTLVFFPFFAFVLAIFITFTFLEASSARVCSSWNIQVLFWLGTSTLMPVDRLANYFFIKMNGIINNIFSKKKNFIKVRLSVYNVLPLPNLLYGWECWSIKAKTKFKIVAAELKFMKKRSDHKWKDAKTIKILNELKVTTVREKTNAHKWTEQPCGENATY